MGFTASIVEFITHFIEATGYVTVFFGMVLESMIFPIPSEAILPFAGFLAAEGRFSVPAVIAVSLSGSLVGSLLSYALGYFGGARFIHKFGRFFLVDQAELEFTEKFFQKRGPLTVFVCRFIPVIRHLISLPAGMSKMSLWKFCLLTLLGAGIWASFLTFLGYHLGQNWELILNYSELMDKVVLSVLALMLVLYIYLHLKKRNRKAGP